MKTILIIAIFTISVFANNTQTVQMKNKNNNMIGNMDIRVINTTQTRGLLRSNSLSSDSNRQYEYSNGDKFDSSSDIIIKFKNKINISDIENNYHLKYIKHIATDYILFKNLGYDDTLNIINRIVENMNENIEEILPNKVLNVYPQ